MWEKWFHMVECGLFFWRWNQIRSPLNSIKSHWICGRVVFTFKTGREPQQQQVGYEGQIFGCATIEHAWRTCYIVMSHCPCITISTGKSESQEEFEHQGFQVGISPCFTQATKSYRPRAPCAIASASPKGPKPADGLDRRLENPSVSCNPSLQTGHEDSIVVDAVNIC